MAKAVPLSRSQWRIQRALEMAPGALTWTILIAPIVASFIFAPYIAIAIFVIDIYWFMRTAVVVVGIRTAYRRMKAAMLVDWWQRCLSLEVPREGPDPKSIVHAVLIPTYTEPYAILRETVRAIAEAEYPVENKVVAIITRESDRPGWENVARLQQEFGSRLRAFLHIKDPLLPGIVVGKSAAMAYGGPVLRRELEAMGLDPQHVIVTDLDSDFRVHRQYFSYITYHYITDPGRLERIYQPIPMFHNNLWRVPFAVRTRYFRAQTSAAPLKQVPGRSCQARNPHFRAQTSAAPLKRDQARAVRGPHEIFPRSNERGPIEAWKPCRRLSRCT